MIQKCLKLFRFR